MPYKPSLYTKPRPLELQDIRTVTKEIVERNVKYVLVEKLRRMKRTAKHYPHNKKYKNMKILFAKNIFLS